MFSGQGSQYYQMGSDLYSTDAVFRDAMDRCSRHVAAALGTSLSELIYQPRADRFAPFDRTLYTHPALFSVQFSLAQSLRARGLTPDVVLGYSLGEWVAHVVAGVLTPEAALDLLVHQAQVVERESPPGGMLAVFGPRDLMTKLPPGPPDRAEPAGDHADRVESKW
jgi:acyl transferase domain-containing protein